LGYTLRALQQAGFADFEELTFFFNSEEEISSPVSKPVYLSVAQKADAVLVLESARANGNLVSSRKVRVLQAVCDRALSSCRG
jgi:acetylornithine deacetylase/succinyl-diaminopimelate desuccinylase-like protein